MRFSQNDMYLLSPIFYLTALLLVAYLLDSFNREAQGGVSDEEELSSMKLRNIVAIVAFVIPFLFFSPGTLPPLVRGVFSAYLLLALLVLGSVMLEGATLGDRKLLDSGVATSVGFALGYTALAIAMIKRGAPGDAFSFELFSSVHPLELLKMSGRIGFFLLFLALIGLMPPKIRHVQVGWGGVAQLQKMLFLALGVRIFSVSSFGSFWEIHTLAVMVGDFFLFWGQVLLLGVCVNMYTRFLGRVFQKKSAILVHTLLLLGGVLGLAMDLSYKL